MASKELERRQPKVIQGRAEGRAPAAPAPRARKQVALRAPRQRQPRAPREAPAPREPRQREPRARAPRQRPVKVKPVTIRVQPPGAYSASRMLTAELIVGIIIVAVRAVADYEPQADGTLKGKIGHPKGQYGPLPILAGLIVSFFLLSFLAASGGLKAKLAVIFGATIDLALLLKSSEEFEKVSATFGTFGKAKLPPGDWQTTGPASGEPISGTLAPAGGIQNLNPKGSGEPGTMPPPGAIPVPKGGSCPSGFLEEGDPKTGAKWCAPTMG